MQKGTIEYNSKGQKIFLPEVDNDYFLGGASYLIENDKDEFVENDIVYAELNTYKKTCKIVEYNHKVDCLDYIKDLLSFDSEDDFYFLQILQRKKENCQLGSNSRVIKNYYIKSIEHLLERYDEIKLLCNLFNARASLRLNKRSFEKVGFKALENIANTMQNREYKHLMNAYDRACGLLNNEKIKKWIVDIDKDEVIWLEQIINAIQPCEPLGNKILKQLPTKTGIHLVTTPFNVMQFKENFKNELKAYNQEEIRIEIHKDNPINLYIP